MSVGLEFTNYLLYNCFYEKETCKAWQAAKVERRTTIAPDRAGALPRPKKQLTQQQPAWIIAQFSQWIRDRLGKIIKQELQSADACEMQKR